MAAPPTDAQITRMAKARVAFKMHAMAYGAVNGFLLLLWTVTRMGGTDATYWPIWTHLGWGLGLAIHGFATYSPGRDMLQKEEDKLRKQYGGN